MAIRNTTKQPSARERMQMDTWEPPPPDKEQKFCKKCATWKDLDQFHKRGGKSPYLAGYCKACHTQPYKYEAICCPHCKEKITFFGVDKVGNVVRQKNEILAKLRKEAKLKGPVKEEQAKVNKALKDIF